MKHKCFLFFIVFTLLSLGGYVNASTNHSDLILYDIEQLTTIKNAKTPNELQLVQTMDRWATKALDQEPLSVTQKTASLASDLHEYVSLSIYYWPDTSQKDGLPYINRDGMVNPEKSDLTRYDAVRKDKLVSAVEDLSLAYYLTGKEEYATKAAELLTTWFVNPETRMNPNLDYGQRTPGNSQGRRSGIIDTTSLIRIVDAAKLLEPSQAFSSEKQVGLKKWFTEYLDWLLTSKLGISEGNATNNHGVWYDAQVASYAWYIGRKDIAEQVVENAKNKRVEQQIEPDGSMPRELARAISMHYTAFNLEAFITLARVGDKVGVNLWNYETSDGRSMQKAIDYFIPYLINEKQWQYAQIKPYHDSGFLRYLYFAKQHYATDQYNSAIELLLSEENVVKEKLATGMITYK